MHPAIDDTGYTGLLFREEALCLPSSWARKLQHEGKPRKFFNQLKNNQPEEWNPCLPPSEIAYSLLKLVSTAVGRQVFFFTAAGTGFDRYRDVNAFLATTDQFVMIDLALGHRKSNTGKDVIVVHCFPERTEMFLSQEITLIAAAFNPEIIPETIPNSKEIRATARRLAYAI